MKKTLSIEPVISTWIGRPWNGYVCGDGDFLFDEELPKGDIVITRIGCRLDGVEPKETYQMYYFLKAMKPGFKGDYQNGFTWDGFLSCTCGHGGCNGYHENVRIHRKKKTVRVRGQRRDGYRNGVLDTGDQVVYFDKAQFDSVREYYVNLFRKNPQGIFQDNDLFFTGEYGLKVWS